MTAPLAAGIALNRFGLGARPGEAPPADPQGWLLAQIPRFDPKPAAMAAIGPGGPILKAYNAASAEQRRSRSVDPAPAPGGAMPIAAGLAATAPVTKSDLDLLTAQRRDRSRAAINARLTVALATETPFMERLAAFWSNHFALSIGGGAVELLAPDFEMEAIRPNLNGRFADMLLAAERHPAMLYFLDQARSVGPNSEHAAQVATRKGKAPGLNENLGREIMELHTLGVRSGYTQADVTELARALTGWAIGGLGGKEEADPIAFRYRPTWHEPGARTVLGRTYPAGDDQAQAVLVDLAASPATAHHLATKLARHFAADEPPPALVDRLAASYLASGGDLPTVYRTLIRSPEPWTVATPKFKSPWDWSVSALRGLGLREAGRIDAAPMLKQLGEAMWRSGQPAGYDDTAATWAAPDALLRRVELAQRLAATAGPDVDARTLAPRLLPGTLTASTATALAQAESGPTALALLLVSPEFQRR